MSNFILERRLDELAGDRTSGASELFAATVAILRYALLETQPVLEVARAVCAAQPTMANVWNAAVQAVASEADPARFDRFVQRVERGRSALVRVGADYLADDADGRLEVVTVSFSRTVFDLLVALAARREIRVTCTESRPALEGQRVATALSAAGIPTTLVSDAAIAGALSTRAVVIVGADAVTPATALNKVGTRMLSAAAADAGCPVYIAATRDKFVGEAIAARLRIRSGAPGEIWSAPPPAVTVENPYFEATPLRLVTTLLTDSGAIDASLARDLCESSTEPHWVAELLGETAG